jgi:hypothetical protein
VGGPSGTMQIAGPRSRTIQAALLALAATTAGTTAVASCTYKGHTYAEGATYQGNTCEFSCTLMGCSMQLCTPVLRACRNGAWGDPTVSASHYAGAAWQSCHFKAYDGKYWVAAHHPCSYWPY